MESRSRRSGTGHRWPGSGAGWECCTMDVQATRHLSRRVTRGVRLDRNGRVQAQPRGSMPRPRRARQ
eukprot:5871284-Pyramimonas_sp.AAC.1